MAEPTTKAEFKSWCKRKLGYPVIDINVDDDQVDDRVDEAIQYWNIFMQNGQQRVYLKHKLTQADVDRAKTSAEETIAAKGTGASEVSTSTLNGAVSASGTSVTLTDATNFPLTGSITIAADATPNAAETVAYSAKTGNVLTTSALANNHADGAVVTLSVDSTWYTGQNYFIMPDGVEAVLRILPFDNRGTMNMFDIRYQLRLNDLYDFSDISIIYYQQVLWQLDLLDMILVGEKPIEFNMHQDRVYVSMDWDNDMSVNDYLIFEVYRKINPSEYTQAYNDFWLKRYATALIKKQWGENLIKFQGVTMLGGVTMNGEVIYNEAKEEISTLETEGRLTYETPVDFDIG